MVDDCNVGASAEATGTASSGSGIQNAGLASQPPQPQTREKRGWFHSLTRRKKSQSQTSLSVSTAITECNNESEAAVGADQMAPTTTGCVSQMLNTNNNNEPIDTIEVAGYQRSSGTDIANAVCGGRKRKEEKGVFQRFRKKIGLHFHSLRQRHQQRDDEHCGNKDVGASGTTDASSEFLTHSPIREPLIFSFAGDSSRVGNSGGGGGGGGGGGAAAVLTEESEVLPFTHDYKRFIVKKWLERDGGPNRIMYKACCEMLSQVWYWGEISRCDAQKQLTDKPTGSFLVRDSETNGSQFTLSFRIVNVTLHYRLEYRDNYWHFEELQYESIVEMIEDILYRCTNDNFVCFVKVPNEMQPPFPVILKYPLSRYFRMPHLQDLCRRVIQRNTSPSEIATLPIPHKLHEYLAEKRELVFQS